MDTFILIAIFIVVFISGSTIEKNLKAIKKQNEIIVKLMEDSREKN